MMINKKGEAGEAVIMIYRIVFLVIVASVILGASNIIYDYTIKTNNVEAMLMGRAVLDCIVEKGPINLQEYDKIKEDIFGNCGIVVKDDYSFVSMKFYNEDGEEFDSTIIGDESLEWVNYIYNSKIKTESIKEYQPGYFNTKFPVVFLNEEMFSGEILLEVIINGK